MRIGTGKTASEATRSSTVTCEPRSGEPWARWRSRRDQVARRDVWPAGVWGESSYPATAVAHRDSLVPALPVDGFRQVLATSPALALAIIRLLGARLREAEARIRDLQNEQVEQRLANVLLRLASKTGIKTPEGIAIGIPLTRQDLAELAGTTLGTVSRTLSAWSQRGLVSTGRERVVLRHPHQIVEIANGPTTAEREHPLDDAD